jgi:hypothetical protein
MLRDKPSRKLSKIDHLVDKQSRLNTVNKELKLVKPYINILVSHLEDVLKETEEGVLAAIDKANALDASYKRHANTLVDRNTNTDSLEILTDLLGGFQFQDVVRQRLQQVCKALLQLDEHLTHLSVKLDDPEWRTEHELSLKEKIENFSNDYVMLSQVEAHLKVNEFTTKLHSSKSVELF